MKMLKKILSVTSKVLIGLLMILMILTLVLRISGSNFKLFGLNVSVRKVCSELNEVKEVQNNE